MLTKIQAVLRKLPWKSSGLWLCTTFAILYAMLGWRMSDTLVYDYDGILFHTDTAEVAEDITEFQTPNHADTNVHPLFVIMINPLGVLLSSFMPTTAAIILLNTIAGTLIVWIAFCCFKELGIPKYQSVLWTILTGCTASNLLFVSLPERHIYAAFSIALMCLLCIKYPGKTTKLIWAGLLTLGITVTNFAHCIILFFVSMFHKETTKTKREKGYIYRTVGFILITLLLAVLLSLLQKSIWPDTRYFFLPEVYAEEIRFCDIPTNTASISQKLLDIASNMFVFNIAAPAPFIQNVDGFGQLTLGLKSLFSYKAIGLLALSGWSLIALLSLNILFLHKNNKWVWLQIGILLCLMLNAAIHMIYGDNMFLYKVNWTFLVVILFASTTVYANKSVAFRISLNTILTSTVAAVVINNALFIGHISNYLKYGNSIKWQKEYPQEWELAKELEKFLFKKNVDIVFSSNKYKWFANITNQKIKIVDVPNERSPALKQKAELVDESYAFLFDSDNVVPFIKNTMGSFSERRFDQYRILYDIVPPVQNLEALPEKKIAALSSTTDRIGLPSIIDLNLDTKWVSRTDEQDSMEFTFSGKTPLSCVRLLSKDHRYPYEWQVELKESPTNDWVAVTSRMQRGRYFWSGPRLFWHGQQHYLEARFITTTATAMRILFYPDKNDPAASISEVRIYGPGDAFPFETTALPVLIEEIREKNIGKLYSERWAANAVFARTSPLRGKAAIKKVETLLEPYVFEQKRSREQPIIDTLPVPVYMSKNTGILTRTENAESTRLCLKERGFNMRETTIGPWILFDFRDSEWSDDLAGYSRLYWGGISCFLADSNGAGKVSAIKLAKEAKLTPDITKAESLLEKALLFYPQHQQSMRQLSKIYRKHDKNSEAEKMQQKLHDLTVPQFKASAKFGKSIEFIGLSIQEEPVTPGGKLNVRYFWKYKPDKHRQRHYSAFVHFKNNNEIIFQGDHDLCIEFSDDELLNQNSEEILSESFIHSIPTNAPTGDYTIVLGIYDKQRKIRLPAKTELKHRRDAVEIPVELKLK